MSAIATVVMTSEEFYEQIGEEEPREVALSDIEELFHEQCKNIVLECESECYPSHGLNYDLRCDNLRKNYE